MRFTEYSCSRLILAQLFVNTHARPRCSGSVAQHNKITKDRTIAWAIEACQEDVIPVAAQRDTGVDCANAILWHAREGALCKHCLRTLAHRSRPDDGNPP